MDFEDSEDEAALRSELRELIRETMPTDFVGAFTDNPRDFEAAQRFCGVMAARGLLTLAWPLEYGGRGGSPWEQMIVREEMWAHSEPRGAQYMGVNWVGPAIMAHGTDAQRSQHLPRIAAGNVIWCQGFSEPDAGSDLASLRTAATPSGDGWLISGQKIWTSYAAWAEWCFLLARTTKGPSKHHGITVFLVPMNRPGIEVRPIAAMIGPHHFHEMYFDDVPVCPEDVVGEVDEGWSIVRETLAYERVGIARYARCDRLLNLAPVIMGARWRLLPTALRCRWARALIHTRQVRLLAYRVIQHQVHGLVDPGDVAAYRIAATQLDQEVGEVLMEIVAQQDQPGTSEAARFERIVDDHWRYAQAATVASGSIEMQRILLARSILPSR